MMVKCLIISIGLECHLYISYLEC